MPYLKKRLGGGGGNLTKIKNNVIPTFPFGEKSNWTTNCTNCFVGIIRLLPHSFWEALRLSPVPV